MNPSIDGTSMLFMKFKLWTAFTIQHSDENDLCSEFTRIVFVNWMRGKGEVLYEIDMKDL